MTIAFGYAMVTYYSTPIPGFGVSFTHLITDQAQNLARQLEASQAQEIDTRLTELYLTMEQPSLLNTLDLIRYYLIVFVLTGARAALLAVISFGWAATGVAVLVGPIFVPFFIVPQLDWLFWGWLKAFIQYAFYQVVAQAFVFVFGTLLLHFLGLYPPPFTVDMLTVAGLQVAFLLFAFIYGLLKVPSLVNSLFTGRSGESVLPQHHQLRRRRRSCPPDPDSSARLRVSARRARRYVEHYGAAIMLARYQQIALVCLAARGRRARRPEHPHPQALRDSSRSSFASMTWAVRRRWATRRLASCPQAAEPRTS